MCVFLEEDLYSFCTEIERVYQCILLSLQTRRQDTYIICKRFGSCKLGKRFSQNIRWSNISKVLTKPTQTSTKKQQTSFFDKTNLECLVLSQLQQASRSRFNNNFVCVCLGLTQSVSESVNQSLTHSVVDHKNVFVLKYTQYDRFYANFRRK